MLKFKNILLFVFAAVFQLSGQVADRNLPRETLKLHVSQELLFPGDVVWFSVFCRNSFDDNRELSQLVFVELINSKNASVERKKVNLFNGFGESYINLPDSLSTGVYTILAYTNWMKNFGEEQFHQTQIAVVNPAKTYAQNTSHKKSSDTKKGIENNRKEVSNKAIYGKREKVNIELVNKNNKLLKGIYSVSVKRKEPQIINVSENILASSKTDFEITSLPDYKGILVSGILSDINNVDAVNEEILLSFPGTGTDLLSTKTDKKGRFHFLLEPAVGNKDLVFILPSENMKLKLEDPFVNGLKTEFKSSIQIDSSSIEFLKEKFFYWQLSRKFVKADSQKLKTNIERTEPFIFYSEPSQSFKIDDYILLDSMVEYFHELIPSVHFNRGKKNYHISVIGKKHKMNLGKNPGVFVDGVPYKDFNNLAKIPANEIDRIDVLTENYYYKNFTFNGIVDIRTKKADFYSVPLQDNMVRVIYPLGDTKKIQFRNTEYITFNSVHQPDLRYLLYWEPIIRTSQTQEFTFYTSDVSGIYKITISGYSEDGDWLDLSNEFEVK